MVDFLLDWKTTGGYEQERTDHLLRTQRSRS